VEELGMATPIVVTADWDPETEVWVATSRDLRGLVTEAGSLEALRAKLPGMILDLLEEVGESDLPASIELIARASDRLIRPNKDARLPKAFLTVDGFFRATNRPLENVWPLRRRKPCGVAILASPDRILYPRAGGSAFGRARRGTALRGAGPRG
jgi:predicted RNase H-like HicB family nuclease